MSMQENQKVKEFIEAGLSVGSNLGDRMANLRRALTALAADPDLQITGVSPVYETEPVGVKPKFRNMEYLNAVILIRTSLLPEQLSQIIHDTENRLGRTRTEDRFAPRIIDIDILYAGNAVCDAPDLTLPHPRWAERHFVLQPLADLRPNLQIPGSTKTVAEHLAALPQDSEAVRQISHKLDHS